MDGAWKLPISFDPAGLCDDLASINDSTWKSHYKQYHYDGDWSALALRSASGEIDDLSPRGGSDNYRSTALLEQMPHVASVLETLAVPMRRVRLMRLIAGSEIKEHIDSYWAVTEEVRLHVPIVTHSDVEFYVGGQRYQMLPGECWYLDVNSPHSVFNRSNVDRVHLVMDCEVGPRIRELIPEQFAFDRPLWGVRFMGRSLIYRRRDLAERARLQNRSQIGVLASQVAGKLRPRSSKAREQQGV